MNGSLLNKRPGSSDAENTRVRAFYTFKLALIPENAPDDGTEFGQWNDGTLSSR
jgi:hypothetical protein